MGSTYLSLHYHLIFSTKNREPVIAPEWRQRLLQYLGGLVTNLGGVAEAIGGVADHVHLLVGLHATHCLADVLRDVKKRSSVWVHEVIGLPTFAWQDGYAAFTVGPRGRGGVRLYIAGQEEHHRTQSYEEELADALALAGLG